MGAMIFLMRLSGAGNIRAAIGGVNVSRQSATFLRSAQPIQAPDGTAAAPSRTYTNEQDCGGYVVTTNSIGFKSDPIDGVCCADELDPTCAGQCAADGAFGSSR